MNIAGTPYSAVARSSCTADIAATASKEAAGRIIAAPDAAAAIVPITQPKQWYSGTGMQIRSSPVSCSRSAMKRPLLTILRWLSSTPLGEPVVPDVYWILAMSPPSISGG